MSSSAAVFTEREPLLHLTPRSIPVAPRLIHKPLVTLVLKAFLTTPEFKRIYMTFMSLSGIAAG
jgi:hypothetical protein